MTGDAGKVWTSALRDVSRFALVAFPKAAGGAFLVALNLALVRFLDPAEYGQFAVALTVLFLADAILGGPFDLAVLQRAGRGEGFREGVLAGRAALHLKIGGFLAATLVVMFAAALLRRAPLGSAPLAAAVAFATICVLTLRSVLTDLQISGRFHAYAVTETLHLGLRVTGVAFVVLSFDIDAAGIIAVLGAASLVSAAGAALAYQPALLSASGLRALPYPEVMTTTGWYLATIAAGALIGRLDVFLLAALSSDEVLGIFAAGQIVATVFELVGSYLQIVVTSHLAAAMREGSIRRLHRIMQGWLTLLALSALLLFLLVWTTAATFILPADFASSSRVVLILLPAAAAAMATIPLALPLALLHRARSLLVFDCALMPIVAGAYIVVIPRYGQDGAASLTCAVTLLRSAYVQLLALLVAREAART